jgi:serine/threonine-protein kinase
LDKGVLRMTTQQPPSRTFGGGDYKEIEPLGQGGFAQVYLVEDNLGRQWALKQLDEELIKRDPRILDRFEREANIQAGLKHPHIAGLHTFNPKEGYLVIEYIKGKTLRKLLDDDFPEGMDLDTALDILRPIEEALTYIHEHAGFAHLDVTPRNILIQETRTHRGRTERHIVLADFGLARVVDSDGWADLSIFAGAPGY